jgi:heme/copper-type cytochrome/quinol oxidase subunit 1
VLFSAVLAATYSMLISSELISSIPQFISYNVYNVIITVHGIVFLFFVVISYFMGTIANYSIPLATSQDDISYPSINNFAFWLLPASFVIIALSLFLPEGGPATGWTLYPPLSTSLDTPAVDIAIFAIHLAGISSILGSINFISTLYSTKGKDSMLIVSMYVTSILVILFIPVLAAAITIILIDSNCNTSFFDVSGGGDSLLYQHIF